MRFWLHAVVFGSRGLCLMRVVNVLVSCEENAVVPFVFIGF